MGVRYYQVSDGEPRVYSTRETQKIACCDCGLVHVHRYRIRGKTLIEVRVWRDERATAARRREQAKRR